MFNLNVNILYINKKNLPKGNRSLKKVALTSLFVGGLLLAGCGETEQPEKVGEDTTTENTEQVQKEEAKTEFNVGEQIKLGDTILTVIKVDKSAGSEWDKPQSGNEFIIVHVKVENAGDGNISYNPFDYKLKNSNGQITDQTFTTIDNDTSLSSGQLAPGGVVEGTIPFEAPVGDAGIQLIYQPNIFNDSKIITVNLIQ